MTSVMADGRARKTGFPGWSTKDGSPAGRLAQPTALTMARWKSSGWHSLRRFPSEVIHKVITSQRYNVITSWLYKVPLSVLSIRFTGAAPEKHDARGVVRGFLPVSDGKRRNPLYFRPKSAMLFIYCRFTAAGKKRKQRKYGLPGSGGRHGVSLMVWCQ